MNKISAAIICQNEEKNIEECIKSILWVDEIVIVDGGSTDDTVKIALKYTPNVFFNKWDGFAKQREFLLSKTKYEWVFSLDADERCSEDLANEIKNLLANNSINKNGFRIPRKSYFLNKWIKYCGWYPGYQLRLFKKGFVNVSDRLVHEGYEVNGTIGFLKNDIEHYTVTSISEFTSKINKYSSLSAEEKYKHKKVNFLDLIIRPFLSFQREFIFKKGFLDGIHGLMVSYFNMITNILTYMKIWELQNRKK